uniref:G domain-containing protein n=1 Tax=Oreochromis aureus TaxID=47969 RepID=A0A668VTH6_OREAU
ALKSPWRPWGNKNTDLQYVKDFQPQNEKLKHIRVLLYGPVGAGKSSFISSVSSTLRGRIATPALYKTHKIPKEVSGKYYPFVFNDIMGLEEGTGVRVEDVKLALMGHVKEGYTFNPVSSLSPSDSHYIPQPSPEDRVHVLVCVCSANKMKEIREEASDLDIPQLAIVTKIDEACGETEKDLKNVYLSKHVKNKMADFSSKLGIPLNCSLPVKNYSHEINTNEDVDTLILGALKMMIDFGDDFTDSL